VTTYVTNCEKAGIPAVALGFADQIAFSRNIALINGVPNIRWVDVPRVGSGEERVTTFVDKALKALTDPLTAKENESGMYTPPEPPRIVFEGTLDDAQVFFQQTTPISNCRNCPIAKMTDGMPVIIPTEQKVKEMLTGSSHKPEEQIVRYTLNATAPGGYAKATSPVTFARGYYATVEKVATIAVMAGCKPEYLPIVLAVASSGGGSTNCPGTSSAYLPWLLVSGPIAKEIGMNPSQEAMGVGNPANMCIGRTATLMTINFGGCITGAVRTDSGSPVEGLCFAEDEESLPTGWETFREEGGYKKTENSLGKALTMGLAVQEYAPSSFRGLIGEGYGGMARRIGIEGKPGFKNFLEYVLPLYIPSFANVCYGPTCLVMHPNMAKSLYDYGFKTKASVYQWMWDTYFITVGDLEKYGWYDFLTAAGSNKESLSGIPYKDLPDDTKLHVFGSRSATENCIIVSVGNADELCWGFKTRPSQYPINPWK
jgi:hypothetical protein